VQLLQIARGLAEGQDSTGLPLSGNPSFFLGAVVIPEAEPLAPQMVKFEKKVTAGAEFFVTPPVFDLEKFRGWREQLPAQDVKILAGVKVLSAEEVEQAASGTWRKVYSVPQDLVQNLAGKDPEEVLIQGAAAAGRLVQQLKSEKLADGVYLKAKGRTDLFQKILETAGL
jgi:methylenetetrahydrofolate reductase (NADPH)